MRVSKGYCLLYLNKSFSKFARSQSAGFCDCHDKLHDPERGAQNNEKEKYRKQLCWPQLRSRKLLTWFSSRLSSVSVWWSREPVFLYSDGWFRLKSAIFRLSATKFEQNWTVFGNIVFRNWTVCDKIKFENLSAIFFFYFGNCRMSCKRTCKRREDTKEN